MRITTIILGVYYTSIKKPLHKVGALLDAKAVHPNRSAFDHLTWIAQSNGIPKSRVMEVLDMVGLTGSRLYRRLVRERGIAHEVHGALLGHLRSPSIASLSAKPADGVGKIGRAHV